MSGAWERVLAEGSPGGGVWRQDTRGEIEEDSLSLYPHNRAHCRILRWSHDEKRGTTPQAIWWWWRWWPQLLEPTRMKTLTEGNFVSVLWSCGCKRDPYKLPAATILLLLGTKTRAMEMKSEARRSLTASFPRATPLRIASFQTSCHLKNIKSYLKKKKVCDAGRSTFSLTSSTFSSVKWDCSTYSRDCPWVQRDNATFPNMQALEHLQKTDDFRWYQVWY